MRGVTFLGNRQAEIREFDKGLISPNFTSIRCGE